MKLAVLLTIVVFINAIMIWYGITDVPGTTLYNFLSNPADWENSLFSISLTELIAAVGLGAIVVGLLFNTPDFILFAAWAGLFYSFGKPLANLFSLISNSSNGIIAFIVVAPIMIIYIMTVLSWWRGRSE